MKQILCIDIGGTRIKSAVLPKCPTLEQVKNASSKVIRTLGWLNHGLPELLNPSHWASLAKYYQDQGQEYDAVAVSVPGPVSGDGVFCRKELVNGPAKVPKQLKDAFKALAGRPVSLIKDADAWMMGFLSHQELLGIETKFPAVIITLGTGAGVSVATGVDRIRSLEVNDIPTGAWRELVAASRYKIPESWHVHKIIGHPFFEWVEKERKGWDYLRIRSEFTTRVEAALSDMVPWMEDRLGSQVRTIVLAGGNAEFVSARALSAAGRTVVSLTDSHTSLKPDLITVLGVETSSRGSVPVPF